MIEEVIVVTKEEADLEVETDTENTEREVQAAQAEVEADKWIISFLSEYKIFKNKHIMRTKILLD